MAQNGINADTIRELYNRVDELSAAISPQPNNNGNINAEVRNIFTRNSSTSSRPPEGRARQQQAAGQVPQDGQPHGAPALSRGNCLPIRRSAFGVRRNFPGQRPMSSQPRRRVNRVTVIDNKPFLRDLILLSGPDETSVPRQGARVLLVENGHVINACRFTKDLSDALVETTIIEAFEGKIPPNVDIELLMSVHTSLVQPTLAPGQCGIDGVILHRLFKQKPVYVRPSRVLLNTRTDCQVNIFSLIIFCAHFYPFCSPAVFATIKVFPMRGGGRMGDP